jgi:hypothetical protein
VIAAFRQKHIKTGDFSSVFSDIVKKAFEVRNSSDYDDFYVISKMDVLAQIENADRFHAVVEKYTERHLVFENFKERQRIRLALKVNRLEIFLTFVMSFSICSRKM